MQNIISLLKKYRVVPVISMEETSAALPLADALLEGGLPVVEITFRTPVAADIIHILSEKRPELLVGAGTLISENNVKNAAAAGAKFGVAPGTNTQIIIQCQKMGFPFIPGVCTPSEVEQALSLGCLCQKFFPASAMGGVKMLQALYAPYAHTGVGFMPTGGISEDNVAEYLSLSGVLACGGTWLASKQDIKNGNWDIIRQHCAHVIKILAQLDEH